MVDTAADPTRLDTDSPGTTAEHGLGPVLLFDGDCAFCTRCAEWLVNVVRPRATVEPWQLMPLPKLGVTSVQCQQAVQWVAEGEPTSAGAAAIAAALRAGRAPWPLLGYLISLPPLSALSQFVYGLVAAHRHRLPGGTPACQMDSGTPGTPGPSASSS